ncbi:MAG: MltA domain-containing protein [Pseudomonadota bacterium]
MPATASLSQLAAWHTEDHAELADLFDELGLALGSDDVTPREQIQQVWSIELGPDLGAAGQGLLTGYYEPLFDGRLRRDECFNVPVYGPPPGLEVRVDPVDGSTTYGAGTAGQTLRPFFSRAEIDAGALDTAGCVIAWMRSAVDRFIVQVQGSGLLRLADGTQLALGFAAKNGHPYTSIGRLLIERGEIPAEEMSLARLREWLEADAARGSALMRENRSFIFFRRTSPERPEGRGPSGRHSVALIPGRSIAVDPDVYPLGSVLWLESRAAGLSQIAFAHDIGSAIRGAHRADLFFGTGEAAGVRAGGLMADLRIHRLVPRVACS